MDNIIKGKSKLEDHAEINKTLLLIFWAIFIGLMYVYITRSYFDIKTYLVVICAFALPGIYFSRKYFIDRKKIKAAGAVCDELIKNSEGYYILTNIFVIGVEGKGIEIEYVILGENGIFIVNTNDSLDKEYITLKIKSLQSYLIRHKINVEKFISVNYKEDMWSNIRSYNGVELSQSEIDKIIMELKILQK